MADHRYLGADGGIGASAGGVYSTSAGGYGPPASSSTGYGFSATVGGGAGGAGGAGIDTKALIAAALANASVAQSHTPGGMAATRGSRRLYIGGMIATTEREVMDFFNAVICRTYQPGEHVVSVSMNHEKHFAFLELRSMELAAAVLELDGIQYRGAPLRIRRPNDYNPTAHKPAVRHPAAAQPPARVCTAIARPRMRRRARPSVCGCTSWGWCPPRCRTGPTRYSSAASPTTCRCGDTAGGGGWLLACTTAPSCPAPAPARAAG